MNPKAIMISIQPQWVEKILNGTKTIEIRKTMPKIELPCKVYIYCTKGKQKLIEVLRKGEIKWFGKDENDKYEENVFITKPHYDYGDKKYEMLGKVVGFFTLNKIDTIEICDPYVFRNNEQEDWWYFKENACLDCEEMMSYIGYGSDHDGWGSEYAKGYAWHIDNLKIYDTPKELNEFSHYIPNNECPTKQCGTNCEDCQNYNEEHETCLALYDAHRKIKRPPQSWFFCAENNHG